MGRSVTRALGVTLTALVLAGCGLLDPNGDVRSDLERNRDIWERASLTSYAYGVERLCFCGPLARGPVLVTVEGGVVTSRAYVESGDLVDLSAADWFPTVSGLYDVIAEAIEDDAFSIDVTWDESAGLPIDIFIDYDENVADEELGFRITELPVPR